MDIKAQIEKAVSSITSDNDMIEKFKKDPVATVKSTVGGVLPDDVTDKIVAAVNAKLAGGKLADAAKTIGGLFGK